MLGELRRSICKVIDDMDPQKRSSSEAIIKSLREAYPAVLNESADSLTKVGLLRIINEVSRTRHKSADDDQLELFSAQSKIPYLTVTTTRDRKVGTPEIRKRRDELSLGDLREVVARRAKWRTNKSPRPDPYEKLLEEVDRSDLPAEMNVIAAIKLKRGIK